MHGKDGSCPNSEEVQAEMSAIRLALEDFEACHIFNVDETGLFFRCLPRRSYIHRHENKRNIRGTAQMNAKDRITAICCTNAVGDKVPIVCIGKSKNPRIFCTLLVFHVNILHKQKLGQLGKCLEVGIHKFFYHIYKNF